MLMMIESTKDQIELPGGMPARIWEGTTWDGAHVRCAIAVVTYPKEDAEVVRHESEADEAIQLDRDMDRDIWWKRRLVGELMEHAARQREEAEDA